ncbi:hypothetical protein D7Y27_20330 [Corallococcus sp. AB004]|uniref:ribonuclease toxin immunity protein CdiI n=1 Tax=Corallococcus TaxID=83461 RepID=UPI000EA04716|nr:MULTISPECIES: ribonuclease toxin immunity protein CdiI [Corallococcus]RKI40477.1 hypothetical protein D7Y27_20330 [Corallococcus sp. AB004]NNC15319.1 hypothetical protein [Corallococcus exiguus]NPC48809.1 hypothetical protein [Corallococcus exiguus]NPC72150.1 hypothetical protein [Corallococcus exiguus]NPD26580.1 hypothetical protein [Corallococcus exiguus]
MPRLSLVSDRDRLFPVQAFFNAINASEFVDTYRNLLNGIGYGFEGILSCEFPGSLDPWEERFDGVRFSIYEEEVIVDYSVFVRFALTWAQAHVKAWPEDKAELEAILKDLPGYLGL